MNASHYDHIRLAQLIEASGLTHEALAESCGVKRLTITRAVNGKHASWSLILRIVADLKARAPKGPASKVDPRELLFPVPEKTRKDLASRVS